MDPEDLREVISAYQKCVAGTVQRFGGFVAKYMGDGVLVYFGYPQAHEDDAERAARAGLELVQAVSGLKPSAPLQTRVGIATGLVVVGDLIGSGEAQERGIVGETPNLAARLQGIAEPNTVVIAGTRKLLGNLFELEDLGPRDIKGIAGPVRAWAALRTSSAEGRFEALHTTGLTPLVGREEELELLLRRWWKVKTGEGQVVLLSGEAGIGKSRLTAALLEKLSSEPHTRLRYFCSPQHTDSAIYPVISQMERAAGFVHDDAARNRLDKLDAVLAQTSTSTEDAALFAEMLPLPNDGRYPALDLTPEQRRQKTLAALVSQMEALARANPLPINEANDGSQQQIDEQDKSRRHCRVGQVARACQNPDGDRAPNGGGRIEPAHARAFAKDQPSAEKADLRPLSFSGHFGSWANTRTTLPSVDFAPNADVRVLYLFRSVSYCVLRLRLLADGATNFRDMPTLMRLRPRRERFHRLNLAGRHAHERLFSGNGDMARLTTNRADQE